MKTSLIMASALALTIAGTGCATKKYVAKTMAPVEARVSATETKNTDQDKSIAAQGKDIETLQTNLSHTNELVATADTKATNAGQAADRANGAASAAQRSADSASSAASSAMTTATKSGEQAQAAMTRADEVNRSIPAKIETAVTMKKADEEKVLFKTNQFALSKEAKESLDAFADKLKGKERFVVEVQGFTDKTGSADVNVALSEKRADAVARYLVNEAHIPLHNVTTLGSGYANPEGDDKTRDGRKMNRRVEVRLYEPDMTSLTAQK